MLGTVTKQPADVRDWDIEFDRWIPDDDTITTAEAIVTEIDADTDLVVDSVQIDVANHIVKVWTSGGVTGTTYKITVTAATAGGRIKETEFNIRVRDT